MDRQPGMEWEDAKERLKALAAFGNTSEAIKSNADNGLLDVQLVRVGGLVRLTSMDDMTGLQLLCAGRTLRAEL